MQVVHKGFDTLDIAIQGNIDKALFEELRAAKELAQERNEDVLFMHNGVAMHVAKSGANGYQLRLSTGDQGAIWMIKRPNPKDLWGIFVSFRSLGLAIGGLEVARRQMAEMLAALDVNRSPIAAVKADAANACKTPIGLKSDIHHAPSEHRLRANTRHSVWHHRPNESVKARNSVVNERNGRPVSPATSTDGIILGTRGRS